LDINFHAFSLNGYGVMDFFETRFVFYFHDVIWALWSN